MKPLEYWTKGIINGLLLSMPAWDFIDPVLKILGALAGLVLTVVLIAKAIEDRGLAKEQRRKLRLENEMRDQELYRVASENKRRFG